MKTISLITATYNADHCLENLIKSIISQKNENIEFIIIDGNSTDTTLSIIKKYKENIDYWISESDKGIYDAWNKGINKASGDWIMFLGADDELLPNGINKYINFLNNNKTNNIDIISAKCELIDKKGKQIKNMGKSYNWNDFRKYMSISHGSTLHNRKLFVEIGYFNILYQISADYEFLLRKKLNSYFIDQNIIKMKAGGMSYSIKGIIETYKIRKKYRTVSSLENIYLLTKGLLGIFVKSVVWDIH